MGLGHTGPDAPLNSTISAGATQRKGPQSLWKTLFEASEASEAGGGRDLDGGKHCFQNAGAEQFQTNWHGGNTGKDWWEECNYSDTGGAVPHPVSEGGLEEFERFSRWVQGSSSNEYALTLLVEQEDLVRDLIFLLQGLGSHTFELCAQSHSEGAPSGAGAGEEKEGAFFRMRSDLRLPGVGVSPLRPLLLEMCVAGSNVHRLEIFIRRNRYGRGKVLGSFCGTLADYLQHYRRQMLSLLPAALHRRARDANPRPSPSHRDIWEYHMVPPTAVGRRCSRELCPALPEDKVAMTLQSARAKLSAMDKRMMGVRSTSGLQGGGGERRVWVRGRRLHRLD